MSLRIEIFHLVFSQFTILQIIKSTRQIGAMPKPILLALLVVSFFWIQLFRGSKSVFATITMYSSFIALSLIDGSLSNHVVTSCCLALIVLSSFNSEQKIWETQTRRAVISFTAVLYFVTGLHKLNDAFFDPHHSCASLYVSGTASWIPEKILQLEIVHACISLLVKTAPIVAVMFELGMPLPLVLSLYWDTREKLVIRTTIFIGAVFHAILALPPSPLSVYPFSAIMVPMYMLMVPRECDGIDRFVNGLSWKKFSAIVPLVTLATLHASKIIFDEDELFEYPNYGLWALSVIWNIISWSVIIKAVWQKGQDVDVPNSTVRKPTRVVIIGLLLFGLTPYIGLRNYPALAMFSNLRTEGSRPNHWIPTWDLFGYQTDVVEIVATNIPEVRDMEINLGKLFPRKLKETNKILGVSDEFYICPPKWPYENPSLPQTQSFSIPWIELRRKIHALERDLINDDSFIEFVRKRPGENDRISRISGVALPRHVAFGPPLGWFEKVFVNFRSFSDRYSPCRH